MADCVFHPSTAALASCRTCGRSLCDPCRRDVRGETFCEACLAARLQAAPGEGKPRPKPVTAPGLPNPTLAAFLGMLPGVGACYNGQYQKAAIHVLMFPMLIAMVETEEIFGFLIPVYFGYMVVDAYKTALARVRREPLPDYLGLANLFGNAERPISAAFGMQTPDAKPASLDAEATKPPLAAVVLIVLGAVLLSGNMGWIPHRPVGTFWPLVLVVIGIVQGRRRLRAHQ